jgi:hypothetical protein
LVIRFHQRLVRKRKLPVKFHLRLAGTALRAARTAAESGRCAVAEMLFAFGTGSIKAGTARTRSLGTVRKAIDAATEGTKAVEAISECWARERAPAAPGEGT